MICASLTGETPRAQAGEARKVSCEAVEFRLDFMEKFSDFETLDVPGKKRVFTCMPEWEGGRFSGPEEERISLLESVLPFADYVSVELNTSSHLRDPFIAQAKDAGVKVIVSAHDFDRTPEREEIIDILERERAAGADISKLAFKANSYSDALVLMDVLVAEKDSGPIIASSMGRYGMVSRVLGPLLGSHLTFASPGEGAEAAEGQLSVDSLESILKVLR